MLTKMISSHSINYLVTSQKKKDFGICKLLGVSFKTIHFLFSKNVSVLLQGTDVAQIWHTQDYMENTDTDFSASHKSLVFAHLS